MPIKNASQALLKGFGRGLGTEAEIEIHSTHAGDHIARSRAGMDVADLPARRLEELIAFVPFHAHQIGQCRCQQVDGIFRELRVGDMALHSLDAEPSAHRAAAAVLYRVAGSRNRRRFAHDAPVQAFAAGRQGFAHLDGAIHCRTFFITGEQKREGDSRVGMRGQELFTGDNHGGDGPLHVRRASPIEFVVANRRSEGIARPLIEWAGRHHIGMSREYESAAAPSVAAPDCPEVAHTKTFRSAIHALAHKAEGRKSCGDQVQATGVLRGDRWT